MSHYRFFVSPNSIKDKKFISSDKSLINQIKNVFRLKNKNTVSILDNSGFEYEVKLKEIGRELIEGVVVNRKLNNNELNIKIDLYCSLLKRDNFELVLQKCTELGINSFNPVIFDNTIVKRSEKKNRWDKIIKEASEQSMRGRLPALRKPMEFREILEKVENKFNLVADEKSFNRIADREKRVKNFKSINVFIGSEGGFSNNERDFMKKNGFLFFNLGKTILRSETAAILGVGILVEFMVK